MKQHVEKSDLTVGAIIGYLTVKSVHPFVCECACGKVVKRTRTAIVSAGVRSCGCKRRTSTPKIAKVEVGGTYGIYTVSAPTDNPRKWDVVCKRCKNTSAMFQTNFLYNMPKRCRKCD